MDKQRNVLGVEYNFAYVEDTSDVNGKGVFKKAYDKLTQKI